MPSGNVKLQRWIDLIAELLSRGAPVTFEELARNVPEYAARLAEASATPDLARRKTIIDSLKRTFERDKDELRRFGIPLESLPDSEGNDSGRYRLRHKNLYLPYLCLASPEPGAATTPKRIGHWGYQALASLSFEADELQAVVDAAAAARALGDPLLATDIDAAMRKLAVDLPVGAVQRREDEPTVILPRARADAAVFSALGDALVRRKVASLSYHAMSTGATITREVEPYGLFFVSGHWYLAARDRTRGALRNFRLNRMSNVKVNAARAQSPDYAIPDSFHLREHARSRHAWELGDGETMVAIVEFIGESGPAMAARRLGSQVEGQPSHRAFAVRRMDAFVRWLMSFAGEAVPVGPQGLVDRYRQEVAATLEVNERAQSHAESIPEPSPVVSPSRVGVEAWSPTGAAAQLRRILQVVPLIADGEEHDLAGVAASVGTDVRTLQHDLHSLVARYDLPGGFVEGVQVFIESDSVAASSSHFLRPMRLTVPELCALELGLAVLRARRAPDEHAVLDRARTRLREAIAGLPGDPVPDGLNGVAFGEQLNTAHLAAIREGLREHRKVRLTYRKSGSATPGERVVRPYALLVANGVLYLVAWCEKSAGIRSFRLDRVEDADVLDETFTQPDGFSEDEVVREGRVLQHAAAPMMRIRYAPRAARWIAEREGRTLEEDGSLVMDHPLVDEEWGLRHVLQYGPEAQVLSPAGFRERVRERLRAMLDSRAGERRERPLP